MLEEELLRELLEEIKGLREQQREYQRTLEDLKRKLVPDKEEEDGLTDGNDFFEDEDPFWQEDPDYDPNDGTRAYPDNSVMYR